MDMVLAWLAWFGTDDGRLWAAFALFGLIWIVKNVPMVKAKLLTTDRRRFAATVVVAMFPAGVMLMDPAVPASEAWRGFAELLLLAMGIQGGGKALLGPAAKALLRLGARK